MALKSLTLAVKSCLSCAPRPRTRDASAQDVSPVAKDAENVRPTFPQSNVVRLAPRALRLLLSPES
ncbi:hypothetical protein E4U43_006432 [Claviceps pusilla]|uniref:Uncharacterized protein n=1 Tax=Claviceps pusilla TaxID=123648 RepID=A0A9P7N0Z5_9HYPO|nr:hypothetical protein E4U43_006432 [Claviceps pusilla]